MSRWIDIFNSHEFNNNWDSLKKEANNVNLDDNSIKTSVNEIARLNKVISFMDELLEGIDPELVPLSTWDSFNSQAIAAKDQLAYFNSNRNISHIANANNHLDNILTYIRPYMVLPKNAASAITRTINKQNKLFGNYIKELNDELISLKAEAKDSVSEINTLRGDIDKEKIEIDQFYEHIFENEGLKEKISVYVDELEEHKQSIEKYYEELLVGTEEDISIKASIARTSERMDEIEEDATIKFDKVESILKSLKSFYEKVEGREDDEGKLSGGLKQKLDDLFSHLSKFEETQKRKANALNDKIESLLPGATSAGLAYKFRVLRRSFSKPIKIYSNLFYISVATLFLVSLFFIVEKIEFWSITFVDLSDYKLLLKNTLYKLPLLLPVLWLALFASKRRSEAQRLQQEYAHKEAISASYQSFKKQIEELNDDDQLLMKSLLSAAIEAMQYNASATLDSKHGDKLPVQELIETSVKASLETLKQKQ
ncbi:hypothetical protein CW740_07600 [Kangiella profundi]|uniref:Uncharacterized protein n=1 Tax=Kangiella profundi TaxID=1561924 RepID=A0A2K9ACE8_9GAMM|nr:hypothetical protein [Kangiella profundi]AUD79117.1 hypothetical protein CW740_07600 [Kangiella profundi]GGF01313.1 hypothetical protein GCM10011356_13780 [Kangiella profundi]